MWKKLLLSFSQATQNIRSRLFHTLLSILGIVIGVAALVAVLSLIDGLEKYAKGQLSNSSVQAIFIQPNLYKTVNKLRIKKDHYAQLDYTAFKQLTTDIKRPGKLMTTESRAVTVDGYADTLGVFITAATADTGTQMAYGSAFTETDVENKNEIGYVNHAFAAQLDTAQPGSLIGHTAHFNGRQFRITGVMKEDKNTLAQAFIPITTVPLDDKGDVPPPMAMIKAANVEEVPAKEAEIKKWISNKYPGAIGDFTIFTDKAKVEQATKGLTLFRLVMGFIVGLSVFVGGIGIMNVLLISVNERTTEIGVRKSMGAKRMDIMLLFLAEAITISLLGSLLGVLLGIVSVNIFVLIIKAVADVPFQAAYTLGTFTVIASIAIAIGVIFGTYPAIRASRLNPVEAIRREV